MRKLIIATRNKAKLREITSIIGDLQFQYLTLELIDFDAEIKEDGRTYEENALIKAKTIGEKKRLFTLAEDSGLEVEVLEGKPGIYSARFCQGTDLDRINKLLSELNGIPQEKREAKFVSAVAIYDQKTKKSYIFKGESQGRITDKPLGENGFGYDPIFYNFDLGKTNAQASFEEKNQVSHRARALKKARSFIISLKNHEL